MDGMKKLTEDWKVKKRRSRNQSFKELIDFKLSSPEEKNKTPVKKGVSVTSKSKTIPKNAKLTKLQSTAQNKTKCLSPLRRSTRLHYKCSENSKTIPDLFSQVIQNSLLSESCLNGSEATSAANEKSIGNPETPRNVDYSCDLSQWGLPTSIVEAYKSRNIDKMFQWQYECLSSKNVLEGGNLIFSAPTSAGKTLVAEILMLKKVTETRKKAIMILPFVSVVREKVHCFQEMFQSAGIVVDGYMGAHNPPGGFKATDIAICTIEKANNLVNRLMEEGRLNELGILVVDELHMLGDHGRGYLLELLITKLLYNCKRNNIDIQIVGMSATLPNLNVLSTWLNSELFRTDFRPVPLQEMFKIGSVMYDTKTKTPFRDLKKTSVSFSDDLDHITYLSIETITAGHGVLIFCPSKNWCENLATTIAKEIYNVGRPNAVSQNKPDYKIIGEKLREHLNGSQLNDIILQLKGSPAGLDSVLGLTVPFGVAFHHAGLTFDERDIIEGAFRQGILKILVATSTLSSGVNLPARRVIIRSPLFCGSVIDVLSYKQMVGRAGRKGIDEEGESILICKESERNVALSLVNSDLRPVKSCLLKSRSDSVHSSLKRALIEVIASGVASSREEVLQYISCTLLHASLANENGESHSEVEGPIEKCIQYLVGNDIIFKHEETKDDSIEISYKPTRLGLAILASGFSPDDALRVLKELQLARRCFVLENDLHILYEVTPPYLSDQMGGLNWMHFLSLWEDLPEEYKRVGELVGVQEHFIGLGIQGRLNKNSPKFFHKLAVHQRFYASLALNDLIQEVPLPAVSEKYDCTRGILQSLQQTTSTFAGMLTVFCNRLGWYNLELLFSSFQKRVHFGIQQELCDLVRLSTLNAQRARALYNAGFETISSLANAAPNEVALVLFNMGSFESAKQLEGKLAEEALQRSKTKRIRITGKQGMDEKEAANLIVEEARNFIKQELGISQVSWKHLALRKFDGDSEFQPNQNSHTNNCSESLETKNVSHHLEDSPALDGYPEIMKKMFSKDTLEDHDNLVTKSQIELNVGKSSQVNDNNSSWYCKKEQNSIRNIPMDVVQNVLHQANKSIKSQKENYPDLLEIPKTPKTNADVSKLENGFISIEEVNLPSEKMISIKEETIVENSMDLDESFHADDKMLQQIEAVKNDYSKLDESKPALDNSLELIDDLCFSELLLSQRAERGCVYISESFTSTSKINLEAKLHGRFSTHATEDQQSSSTEPVLITTVSNPEDSNKISRINSLLNDSDVFMSDSIFSVCLPDSNKSNCRIITQNIDEVNCKVINQPSSNELPNACNNFLNKSELNAHSTPIRHLKGKEILLGAAKPANTLHKDFNYSTPKLPSQSPHSSEKEISADETSGEIFDSEGSFNHDCLNEKCKNGSHSNENSLPKEENIKFVIETSGDIFDEESFDNAKGMQNSETVNPPIDKLCTSLKQQSTTSSKKLTSCLSNGSDALKFIANCKESIRFKTEIQNCEEMNREPVEIPLSDNAFEKGNVNCKESKVVHPEEESQFWKSWNPSDDSLNLTNISQNFEFVSKNAATYKQGVNASNDMSLTLDSADNSLFNSFNSDCLPPTPLTDVKKTPLSSCKIALNFESPFGTMNSRTSINEKCPVTKEESETISKQLNADEIKLKIVDVLDTEIADFLQKMSGTGKISFSVACEKTSSNHKSIGPPRSTRNSVARRNMCIVEQDIAIVGIAICCGTDTYYITISDEPTAEKIPLIQQFFNNQMQYGIATAYDVKSQCKMLWQGCSISLKQNCMDPSIAAWLLDPAQGQQSLKLLSYNYWPESVSIIENFDNSRGSLGLQHWSSTPAKLRASTEAFIAFHLMEKLLNILNDQHLHKAFTKVEMPSILAFAKMEQNGLGFNSNLAVKYQQELQRKQQDILDKAYQMAGRRFNILSSKEISRILFNELKLGPTLTPDSPSTRRQLAIGTSPRSRKLPPELKTNKECLEKILHLHPLPKAILDWRRLSFATTKVLMPLLRKNKYDNFFNMDRIYATSYVYTLTGRVNVHNPNLQFVPRDFNIDNALHDDGDGNDENIEEAYHCTEEDISQFGVSLRNLFVPSKGNMLLSADYSQLELRILAHLSREKILINSLNSGEDVFKSIAANWKNIPVESVSNEQRQQAKKICYGMIYGISANTLSQQLNTTKENASNFMETFKNSYPGLSAYFKSVIENCSANGFVSTLMQRRRYLPLINSKKRTERAHAERQAINTTIQGSAADLIKAAMIKIEENLQVKYPDSWHPYSSVQNSSIPSRQLKTNLCRGGFLVLQMHDELIYEVNRCDIEVVLKIVKDAMEKTTELTVKLPVRIRTGLSWGEMIERS